MNSSELQPNLKYIKDCIPEINTYLKNKYDLVSVDTGYKNLILLKNYNQISMRYTDSQYYVETKLVQYKNKLYEIENKIKNKIALPEVEKLKYKQLNRYVKLNRDRSFIRLLDNITTTFGKNIILCIGDTGYNPINMKIVNFLSKKIPCYLVDETNTSKLCCKCNTKLVYVKQNNEILSIRVVQCPKCRVIFNKDSNACTNILNKVIKILNIVLVTI